MSVYAPLYKVKKLWFANLITNGKEKEEVYELLRCSILVYVMYTAYWNCSVKCSMSQYISNYHDRQYYYDII